MCEAARIPMLVLVVGLAVCLSAPGEVSADWYDDFKDRSFWQGTGPNTVWNSNDPNPQPSPDPNLWDVDNPHWWFYDAISAYAEASIVDTSAVDRALRLYSQQGITQPLMFFAALVLDGENDPNLSAVHWDDTTNHYILTKVYYPGDLDSDDPDDPNNDKGEAYLMIHASEVTWNLYALAWSFGNQTTVPVGGGAGEWPAHQHYTQHIQLVAISGGGINMARVWIDPNGVRDPNLDDPNDPAHWASADPNDTMWREPPEPMNERDPNYDEAKWLGMDLNAWERAGFWAVLQFEPDPNYDLDDPNGKFLRAAVWSGDKYAWDGEWLLSHELSDPYWGRDDPNDSADWYWAAGKSGVAAASFSPSAYGSGYPADVGYGDIEARTGIFTNVSRALTLKLKDCSDLTVDPDRLDDPNQDPNDLSELRRYTDGTAIVLSAVVPVGNKVFKKWTVKGPNDSGDPLYQIVTDTNEVVYLAMDGDYLVKATCKCGGGGIEPFAGIVLLVLGLGVIVRRLT